LGELDSSKISSLTLLNCFINGSKLSQKIFLIPVVQSNRNIFVEFFLKQESRIQFLKREAMENREFSALLSQKSCSASQEMKNKN